MNITKSADKISKDMLGIIVSIMDVNLFTMKKVNKGKITFSSVEETGCDQCFAIKLYTYKGVLNNGKTFTIIIEDMSGCLCIPHEELSVSIMLGDEYIELETSL